MAFHDARLPEDIDYGYAGGPGFQTIVQQTASGHEYRVARAAQGRHRYSVSKSLLNGEEWSEVRKFALERRGSLHGFRLKDWLDYASTESGQLDDPVTNLDQFIATGNGTETQFQLRKVYERDGINPYYRPITLPVAGTVVVAVDGGSTGVTLTNPGGVITFAAAPAGGAVITAGFQFDVPVRFDESADRWLRADYTDWDNIEFSRVGMVELLNEVETVERRDPGGSYQETITTDVSVSAGMPFLLSYTVNTTGLSLFLPPPDRLVGGEHYVVNVTAASSGNLTIRDDAGTAVSPTLAANTVRRVALIYTGSTATWITYA